MTIEELRAKFDIIIPILDIIAKFTPDAIDRGVEYVKALRASDELLTLIAEDITNLGGLDAIETETQPDGTLALRGRDGQRVLGDGSLLKKLFENLPAIIELLKLLRG